VVPVVPDEGMPVEPGVLELLDEPVDPPEDGMLDEEPEDDPMPDDDPVPEDDPEPEDESEEDEPEDDEPLELG
jgi:hypothetical protein